MRHPPDAMLFDCAICFAVASLALVGVFGLLVVLRVEPSQDRPPQ
jgi:hypothetical protein